MTVHVSVLAFASLVVLATACGSNPAGPPVPPDSPLAPQPTRSVHLRAAFDNEPSTYVGRMVARDAKPAAIDENGAFVSRCGQFVKAKVVDANQDYDEQMYASSSAAGNIGVAPFASASANASSNGVMRVKYTLKKKMQSEVTDIDKFSQCCATAPDQCSNLMIGTFLMGSGEVYQLYGSKKSVEASGMAKEVSAAIDYKDDAAWKRVNHFENTYFAFLTTGVGPTGGGAPPGPDATCSWCDSLPTSLDGTYYCGISPNAVDESMARDLAMRHAREQVLKYLGEYLSTKSASAGNMMQGWLEDKRVVEAASQGIASRVKDQKWCAAERTDMPNGKNYKSKVLAFFPEASRKDAARVTLEAILQTRKSEKKLSPEEEKQLRTMIDEQK